MPLPLTVSCSNKIQIGFTFLLPAHLGSPGQRAVKRVCVLRELTYRTDPSTADSREVGILLMLLPILGVKSQKKNNFGGVNRRFQAKLAKYWKFHIIESTASISTRFCTTIETTECWSRVVPICAQQIQDGGRPPFWKPLNCYISATVWPILTKFGTVTHIGGCHLENHNNRTISTKVWPIFTKFGMVMQNSGF